MLLDYFSYFLYLGLTVLSIYLVIIKREFVKEHRNTILFFFVGILAYSQYARYFSDLFTMNFSYEFKDLPLNYCRISAILIVVYAFTKNKYLGQFLYFQAGLGFFSILFPGGNFFVLALNHRDLGYIYDHYMIALMTVFLIYIDNIKPTKIVLYVAIIYSLVIPFSLLPYALNTGHNVFYILDGVFIPMVFGKNQVVISIIYVIGIILYYIVMYKLSFIMAKHRDKERTETPFFKPLWIWIVLDVFIITGIILSRLVPYVPSFVQEHADTFSNRPLKAFDEVAYVYNGEVDGDTYYYVEIIKKFKDIEVLDENGNVLPVTENGDIYYFNYEESTSNTVIVMLYKDKGTEEERVKVFTIRE